MLASRDSSIAAVKKICQLLQVDFSNDYLNWEPLEDFDPTWDVPHLASCGNEVFGFFQRANKSTTFEDAKERDVDLDALADERPEMVDDIKKAQVIYKEICDMAEDLK